jgi:hypothetical protein
MNAKLNFNFGKYLCDENFSHVTELKRMIQTVQAINKDRKFDLRITWWNDGYEEYSNTCAELVIRHIDRAVRDANDMPDDVKQMMIDEWKKAEE